MTISIFGLGYAVLYPLFDIWLVLYAVFVVATRKRTSKPSSRNMATLGCYGLLGAISFYSCSGLLDIYYLLSIAALILLDVYVEDSRLFQLVNVVGVFRAICDSNSTNWLNLLSAAIHGYLFCSRLSGKGLQVLVNIREVLLYTKELRLIGIQRVRNIVLSDIEALPKRMLLESSLEDLKYNVNEPMFLLRAIFRMMWQPIIPLLALTAFLNTMKIMSSVASGRVLYFFDFPLEYSWYGACFNVMMVFVLSFFSEQLSRVGSFIDNEATRVINALRLTLFRLPLLNDGLQNNYRINKARDAVRELTYGLRDLFSMYSKLTNVVSILITLYVSIGWLAFVPLVICFIHRQLEYYVTKMGGIEYMWELYFDRDKYDDKVDEIFYNIKSIKMFGWERVYTDTKLQKHWKGVKAKEYNVWYTPITKVILTLFNILDLGASEISLYILVLYMHYNPYYVSGLSTTDIFQLSELVRMLQFNFKKLLEDISSLRFIVETTYTIEQALRGDYINTLRHNALTLENKKSNHSTQQKSQLMPIVTVEAGEFAWTKDKPVVKGVSFEANPGNLVAVVGKTGSGKSSLLMSICGEVEMIKGTGAVVGSIALVEQKPWIMSGTLRENILFGRDYDEEFYNKVVFSCALSEDIANWKDGDRTRIGERGMNISGGQMARLALARAVYSRADIYILDDPLSAVDPHVMRHILDHVIMDTGILSGKIRIMSLHESRLLPFFNTVLQLEKDKDVVTLKQEPRKYQPKTVDMSSAAKDILTLVKTENDKVESVSESESNRGLLTTQSNQNNSKSSNRKDTYNSKRKTYGTWETLWYVVRLCGFSTLLLIGFTAAVLPISMFMLDSYKLAFLKNRNESNVESTQAMLNYLLVCIIYNMLMQVSMRLNEYTIEYLAKIVLEPKIKNTFIDSIIHAPLSFFDSTARQDISQSYNTISKAIAYEIPSFLMNRGSQILRASLTLYRIGRGVPHFLVLVPIFIWVSLKKDSITIPVQSALEDIYNEVCIDENKVEDIIADGQQLIRAFNVERHFTSKYIKEKNKKQQISIPVSLFEKLSWMVIDFVSGISKATLGMAMVLQGPMFGNNISSAEFMIYSNLLDMMIDSAENMMRIPSELVAFKSKICTFRGYIGLEREELVEDNAVVPKESWPSDGKIEFNNFSMKYHEDLEYVLKEINLIINPKEKIGIVGRTGAGKTSLARCLFQLIDKRTCNGSIRIDEHDTFSMNRRDVRAKLGIIPQDPTLFSGSYRQNLDPLVKYSVEDMWSAIIKCGIDELVQPKNGRNMTKDEKIVAEGEYDNELKEIDRWNKKWNSSGWAMRAFLYFFVRKPVLDRSSIRKIQHHGLNGHVKDTLSNGQKQLFGLCRLLMRNRKIIVLDEATSSMDQESDQDMQKLIHSEFKNCTVLTIAHRLKTIMGSDRIVVMDNGRVVEVGPPSELLEKGGYFAELVKANEF